MRARHPLTGKDIRILSFDTSIHKDTKTLAWLDEAPLDTSWSRYEIGVTSISAATALQAKGLVADVVICLGPHDSTAQWCVNGDWSSAKLVAVTKAFVEHIGLQTLSKLRMGNLICLDEIHAMYPFVGAAWNGTMEDAKILLAMILQMSLTAPAEPSNRPMRGLKAMPSVPAPQPLWLVTQYYIPEKGRRRSEIETCLQMNLACPLIDRVVLLNEKACAPQHEKLEEHVIGKRLLYSDVIRWIYENVPANVIVVFANADIFLDGDSWRNLWSTNLEVSPKFLALLRWDVESATPAAIADAKLFGPRADSQDTWVVASNAVKAVNWDWKALDFPFGKGGCDNAITVEMFKKGFLVTNPALSLKTYHLHTSGVRGYNPADIVDKPTYMHIHPSGLHDKKPVTDLEKACKEKLQLFSCQPFERRVKGPLTRSQLLTFCTMVGRSTQGLVTLDADGPNVWEVPPVPLYRMKDVFQTRDGLVYTHDSILVGKTKAGMKAWSESQISYLSASLQVDDAMIAPLPDSIANSPSRFILEYLPKIFLLRQEFDANMGEFWCSKEAGCVEAIKMFSWPSKEIPVLSRNESQQAWCSSAAMWPHQDLPEGFVSREEIGALRGALGLGGWVPERGNTLVVVVDGTWITDEVADSLEKGLTDLSVRVVWAGRTSLEVCIQAMQGAWGLIAYTKELAAWSWVLPKGAFLWDIQSEMAPSASLLHTACAAELEHRLTIVPRGANDVERAQLVTRLLGDIRSVHGPVPVPTAVTKPKLFLPSGHKGFYAHAGDSFREIASLWAERGYVVCVPSAAHQVWLHAVGDTLLYDRPTHQWLEQAPRNEQTWRCALFGNPSPPKRGKVSSWSFWPRRPALVEAAVVAGLPKRSWESREQSVVFYGRSENAIQKSRRSTDWSAACSEFVHVDGLKPYPYTAQEYLERLAKARYGLCLAGYGFKCHREIECMAMGCVPIVAPEVDMDHYAVPPEEGLHYFRVKGPDDVAGLIQGITGERWTVMSAACRDWWEKNASVDGMWELTKRLTFQSSSS